MTAAGKAFLVGLCLAVAGAIYYVFATGWPPRLDTAVQPQSASVFAVGCLIALAAAFVYVFQPTIDRHVREGIRADSPQTVLAMLLVALTIANLASLPVILIEGRKVLGSTNLPVTLSPAAIIYLITVSELPILLVLWLRVIRTGHQNWRGLGLRVSPVVEHVGQGIAGGAALLGVAAVTGLFLNSLGVRQDQYARYLSITQAPVAVFLLVLAAGCALAPFVEELFFRGFVFQALRRRWGRIPAYGLSAALFAVLHLNLPALLPIFAMGLVLAYLFERTDSLLPGMIGHGLNNAISFSLLYFVSVKG